MKLTRKKTMIALAALLFAVIIFAFLLALSRSGHLTQQSSGALGGIMGGLAGGSLATLVMGLIYHRASAAKRRAMDLNNGDERNIAIRDRAAYTSWFCSLAVFLFLFMALLLTDHYFAATLTVVAALLHMLIFPGNIYIWNKKL